MFSGVNLTGIVGDAQADPEGLVGEGSEMGPPPRKNI